MQVCSEQISSVFIIRKYLSSILIGIGLGNFLIWNVMALNWNEPIGYVGLAAFVLGIIWFLMERRKIGFGKLDSVLVFSPIVTFLTLGFFPFMIPVFGFAHLFIACAFFTLGLVGIYINRGAKKIGCLFLVIGLLFLIIVALANLLQFRIEIMRLGHLAYVAAYRNITPSFVIMGFAFLLLGSILILYRKVRAKNLNLQQKLGFSFTILSFLILVIAAITCAPSAFMYSFYDLVLSSIEPATSYALLGAAVFVLGFALFLYRKSNRIGFFAVAFGCFFLVATSIAYTFQVLVRELQFYIGDEPVYVSHLTYPWREYSLPLSLVGVAFAVAGYVLMLIRSRQNFLGKTEL